jgi:plasmid stabilization system protein ParE
MAKGRIIWSHKARIKLTQILEFYNDRNQSNTFSTKLYWEIQKSIKLLLKQPSLGTKTNEKSIRALIVGDYIIFYETSKNDIIIHTIWDCRQNPEDLIIK